MEKKSKAKTIVIVILVLAVLGLGGYIAYDKVLSKETEEPIKKETTEVKTEEGFNLDNKSEIQALNSIFGSLYITKDGNAFLAIDDLSDLMGTDENEKNIMEKLKQLHQDNTIEGICLTGDSQYDKEWCENGDIIKSIKLDIDNAVSGYDFKTGQDVGGAGIMIIRADGTVSAIMGEDLLEGKVELKNNVKNLKNIVTIVQSRNNHAFEVIAIEKDGTQHIIDTFE